MILCRMASKVRVLLPPPSLKIARKLFPGDFLLGASVSGCGGEFVCHGAGTDAITGLGPEAALSRFLAWAERS